MVIDIGAGDGCEIPIFSESVGKTGLVIAIEAHPVTFSMLERVCHWNKLDNVTCHMKAILPEAGTTFISDELHHVSNQLVESGIAVNGVTLDQLTADLPVIDFVKMNIEGAERNAIDGMSESIKKTRHVCFAAHDFRADRGDGEQFRTRKVVTEFLQDHGFEIRTRRSDTRPAVRDHIHGWLPTLPGNHHLGEQHNNKGGI